MTGASAICWLRYQHQSLFRYYCQQYEQDRLRRYECCCHCHLLLTMILGTSSETIVLFGSLLRPQVIASAYPEAARWRPIKSETIMHVDVITTYRILWELLRCGSPSATPREPSINRHAAGWLLRSRAVELGYLYSILEYTRRNYSIRC